MDYAFRGFNNVEVRSNPERQFDSPYYVSQTLLFIRISQHCCGFSRKSAAPYDSPVQGPLDCGT